MNWNTSNRRGRLPSNWQSIRLKVAKRAKDSSTLGIPQCEYHDRYGRRCRAEGAEADHVRAGAGGDCHDVDALQWLCKPHHKWKTQQDAAEGKAAKAARRYRRLDEHPSARWRG